MSSESNADKKLVLPHSLLPAYAFYGSNSSHSTEHGTGGRTYHVPNYATSYANDRTKLITVTFDEGPRGNHMHRVTVVTVALVIAFLLFTAVPLSTTATWSQYFI